MSEYNYELIEAKRELYYQLLQLNKDEMNDGEINIMYELSMDRDIQLLLSKRMKDRGTR